MQLLVADEFASERTNRENITNTAACQCKYKHQSNNK